MKVIVFVENGRPCAEDLIARESFRAKSHQAYFSNGSVKTGFEDSCDAVYLAYDFPYIEKWAVSKQIEVIKPEVKKDAESLSDRPKEEEKEEAHEEVKPKRRGRKPQADKDPS